MADRLRAATTDATSVGTAAITRFQEASPTTCAPGLLPPPLRDNNAWDVSQRRSPAVLSRRRALTGTH
ncbi:hypothetical protein [Microbacterium candidum]|uniref:hypothetical protein n=1 Tax=Microbacterium candidum TaxID=3041922 RepID=UPI00257426C7|nr:hypothetical protein [Microbacterium sp. ASV49]